MKRFFICTAMSGLIIGIIGLVCKVKKANSVSLNSIQEKSNYKQENGSETPVNEHNVVNELDQIKERSAQTVYERHSEATEIMTDAFNNILKEVEQVELNDETVQVVIDAKDVKVINELDSLSDELDELLK